MTDETTTLVSINADGLIYVLNRLGLGFESMPPILAITPTAFYEEDAQRVEQHVIELLVNQGIIQGLQILPELAHWLTLVAQSDRRMEMRTDNGSESLRMCLIRTGDEHVLISRFDDDIVIHPVATAAQPFPTFGAAAIVTALGPGETTSFPPQTFAQDELDRVAGNVPREDYANALRDLGAAPQAATAIQAVADAELTRTVIGLTERSVHGLYSPRASVAIHDAGPAGRIVASVSSRRFGDNWVTISPGTEQRIRAALEDLEEFLPSRSWYGGDQD